MIGPVIIVIGLSVAAVATQMAMGKSNGEQVIDYKTLHHCFNHYLRCDSVGNNLWQTLLKTSPHFDRYCCWLFVAAALGLVEFEKVIEAPWFKVPQFVSPEVNWMAALFMLPVAIAPAIEHIGGIMAIGKVTGKDYASNPG
ncbi:solute carrier family 23 protein [Ignatzschineria indica]|uniref:solute carrier family 23 protein n=1 Tax=Ignatzschineria indica TaxID=472583 RepID=UPI00363E91B6